MHVCVCVCVCEQCGVTLALCGSRCCVCVCVVCLCRWVGGWVRVSWCVCIHNCLASCCAPI